MNEITVQKVLETKYLKDNHIVIAGSKGLDRQVKWLHILGSSDIMEGCLNEGTLIMTTGVDFVDREVAIRYITQLVNEHTAGLMIETVMHYHEIDQALIDIANANDFPLIRIPKLLRFLDCSQGVNTMIMQQEEQRKKELAAQNKAWIQDWLSGKLSKAQIADKLGSIGFSSHYTGFVVCGIERSSEPAPVENTYNGVFSTTSSHSPLLEMERFFEESGITTLAHADNQMLIYIFFEKDPSDGILEKVRSVINMQKSLKNSFLSRENCKSAVGKMVFDPSDLYISMQTMMQLLEKDRLCSGKLMIYDQLYIRRLFLDISDGESLQRYIGDMLNVLIEPANEPLLNTLQVYFRCNCSKQKTAEELYISRQALYARLNKIRDILGEDFDLNEKRLAIECAIAAVQYQNDLS